jgi:hypothetical protein
MSTGQESTGTPSLEGSNAGDQQKPAGNDGRREIDTEAINSIVEARLARDRKKRDPEIRRAAMAELSEKLGVDLEDESAFEQLRAKLGGQGSEAKEKAWARKLEKEAEEKKAIAGRLADLESKYNRSLIESEILKHTSDCNNPAEMVKLFMDRFLVDEGVVVVKNDKGEPHHSRKPEQEIREYLAKYDYHLKPKTYPMGGAGSRPPSGNRNPAEPDYTTREARQAGMEHFFRTGKLPGEI